MILYQNNKQETFVVNNEELLQNFYSSVFFQNIINHQWSVRRALAQFILSTYNASFDSRVNRNQINNLIRLVKLKLSVK